MNPTQHTCCNAVLGAPAGWNQAELTCNALAIHRGQVEGQPTISSFWRPDADELAALNAGGLVMLTVFGNGMPPVSLSATVPE